MKWAGINKLQLNKEKPELMIFMKGGKAMTTKCMHLKGM
jgi:hypothetical protein